MFSLYTQINIDSSVTVHRLTKSNISSCALFPQFLKLYAWGYNSDKTQIQHKVEAIMDISEVFK